jgi:hypothetical protein
MAKIVEFPSLTSRAWAQWEREIRVVGNERDIPDEVVTDALPRLRSHWEAIFEAVDLELPPRPVPGTLTKQQAKAIQGLIDDTAGIVLERLRHERSVAFQRFVVVELALSNAKLSPSPPGAA